MGIVAIACDTVRRDRGCGGGFVNGATVGFVLLADTFDDPENARIILLSAAALVVLGLLIAAGTVWWWRTSEVEHPALGPLEVMGSRSWWKGDYTLRRRRLEAARPEGAEPIDPLATSTSDPVDLEAAALAPAREFDDLSDVPPETAAQQAEAGAPPAELLSAEAPSVEAPSAAVDGPVAAPDPVAAADPVADLDHEHNQARDGNSVADVPRPIDPLLRLQHDE